MARQMGIIWGQTGSCPAELGWYVMDVDGVMSLAQPNQ
jgi:hypothetical protein